MKIQVYADNKSLFQTIVESAMRHCDINRYCLKGREILFEEKLDGEILRKLEKQLMTYGFDVERPERINLARKIADMLTDVVYNEEPVSTNLSTLVCERTGMSYPYAAKVFSGEMGCTIEEFYIGKKIERAKQLIVQGELTFKEIAYKLGYCSLGHLSKQFKRYTGITLTYFRENYTGLQ